MSDCISILQLEMEDGDSIDAMVKQVNLLKYHSKFDIVPLLQVGGA